MGGGMRCAEFHVDARSDDPGPRCGHTLTCVPAEGGGQRLIVFGGATALEGDGPNGSTSGIRASPPHLLSIALVELALSLIHI